MATNRMVARQDADEADAEIEFVDVEPVVARILLATYRCARHLGTSRMTMGDIAQAADIARSTLYRYFDSKEAVVEALGTNVQEQAFRVVQAEAEKHSNLTDQVAAVAIVARSWRTFRERPEWMEVFSPADEMWLLGRHAVEYLDRLISIFVPLVAQAKKRGEIRANVDVESAAEWLGRIVFTLVVPAERVRLDVDDERVLKRFFKTFAIDGLGPPVGLT